MRAEIISQVIETPVNKPFRIPPPPNNPLLYEETNSRLLVADYGLRVVFPKGGALEGGIQVYKDPHFHTARRDRLRRTPLGEIRVATIVDGDKRRIDPATLPYQVEVQLHDLNYKRIQSVRIYLHTLHPQRGEVLFDAIPRVVKPEAEVFDDRNNDYQLLNKGLSRDDVNMKPDEKASLYFRTWIGPGSIERCIPYLPPSDESFTTRSSLFVYLSSKLFYD